jgi:UDP-2,3-diacylglucosamine pyrophosphatase LpxH
VINGDILNASVTSKIFPSLKVMPYLAYLFINKKYNEYRYKKGFSYRSILAGNLFRKAEYLFINNVREDLIKIAMTDSCDGIICGNNHRPCVYQLGIVSYLNAGFWSESNVGLVESNAGNWKLLSLNETIEEDKEAKRFYRMQKRLMEKEASGEELLKVKIA